MTTAAVPCANCGRPIWRSPDQDVVAHAEAVEEWGRRGDDPNMAIVCAVCARDIMAWLAERARAAGNN